MGLKSKKGRPAQTRISKLLVYVSASVEECFNVNVIMIAAQGMKEMTVIMAMCMVREPNTTRAC